MRVTRFNTFGRWTFLGLFLPFFALSSCEKLKDQIADAGPHATVYPSNGATNVPVNTIIEIQYPPEFGLKIDQMKKSNFSVQECENDTFAYLNPQNNQGDPSQPAKTETTTASTDTKTTDPTTGTETKKESTSTPAPENNKYIATVKFFHTSSTDKTNRIFNYLVIDPENRETPLKSATTYCVKTLDLKNEKGEKIVKKEISFTTEESPAFAFDSKISVEFLGSRMAPTVKNKKGVFNDRDYVLMNFRSQYIRPSQLKDKIKVCKQEADGIVAATEPCKDFGKEVPSDVFMIEGFQATDGKNLLSEYNLFAVSPRVVLNPEDKFRIYVDIDLDKSEDGNVGLDWHDFEVDNDPTVNWINVYKNDAVDGDGKPRYSTLGHILPVGSGS